MTLNLPGIRSESWIEKEEAFCPISTDGKSANELIEIEKFKRMRFTLDSYL
jgi:hypothetical protein